MAKKANIDNENLDAVRHSLAHLLAAAVLKKYPKTKLGIGPTIENGFYYDFQFPQPISELELKDFEKEMRRLINQKLDFKGEKLTPAKAKKMFRGQPFKQELIKEFTKEKKKLTAYHTGDIFTDLCRGGHVKNTKEINPEAFKLTHLAGAYWRGSEKNPMLTRIYGLAFRAKKELDDHLKILEEAKKRDHRVLGERLKIFAFSDQVGPGFPLWLPNGEFIKHQLQEYMREKEEAQGYQYVSTPVLTQENLYQRSGHKQYFAEDMYKFEDPDGVEMYVKPMNCPHTHMIYEKLVQSYRDLPLRLAEPGTIYRFERSGTLTGLIRVRGAITQNDAHIYVTPEQLAREFQKVLELFKEVYSELGIKDYWFRLSLPDFKNKKNKFGGNLKMWKWASEQIRRSLEKSGMKFEEAVGEAAFYGPKLDVQAKNVLGKEDTIATAQVDILVPERMGLAYINEEGQKETPIVIHRAIMGSYERFIAFLLEQTAGNLPLWLSPVQIVILPISEKQNSYAEEVAKELKDNGFRVRVNMDNSTVGKRIRESEMQKIPFILVVGENEKASKTVSVRQREKGNLGEMMLEKFMDNLNS